MLVMSQPCIPFAPVDGTPSCCKCAVKHICDCIGGSAASGKPGQSHWHQCRPQCMLEQVSSVLVRGGSRGHGRHWAWIGSSDACPILSTFPGPICWHGCTQTCISVLTERDPNNKIIHGIQCTCGVFEQDRAAHQFLDG